MLGEFKAEEQREYAAEYLMTIIRVSQKPVNGEYEDKTLKASIKALGALGYYSPEIRGLMKDLYEDFPDETKDAMKKLLTRKIEEDQKAAMKKRSSSQSQSGSKTGSDSKTSSGSKAGSGSKGSGSKPN